MKNNVSPTRFFSAYPLKEFVEKSTEVPASNHSPYLKAILSGKTRTLSRVRVFPMINPYKKSSTPVIVKTNDLPNDVESSEKEWFNNYE